MWRIRKNKPMPGENKSRQDGQRGLKVRLGELEKQQKPSEAGNE